MAEAIGAEAMAEAIGLASNLGPRELPSQIPGPNSPCPNSPSQVPSFWQVAKYIQVSRGCPKFLLPVPSMITFDLEELTM